MALNGSYHFDPIAYPSSFFQTLSLSSENHDVFVWGYGLLGKGPELDHSMKPQLLPRTLFGRNDFAPDVKVTSVHAGEKKQIFREKMYEMLTLALLQV